MKLFELEKNSGKGKEWSKSLSKFEYNVIDGVG